MGVEPDGMGNMIGRKELMQARRALRKRASKQFPELTAADIPGPSLEAALKANDINVDETMKFVYSVIKANRLRLADQGVVSKYQQALYAAAMANGIAIGVLAADLED